MKHRIQREAEIFQFYRQQGILTSSCRCTVRGRFLGRRGGRDPRIAAKSSAISSLDSAMENPRFLASAAGAGGRSTGTASSAVSPDPAGRAGAAVADRRVRRFHGCRAARWRCSGAPAPVAPPSGRRVFSLSRDGVSGAAGGGDEAWPLLEQRSTRCVPQLRVGKEKSWRRVREGGGAPGAGARELGGGGENLAPQWWSLLSAPMRTMGGAGAW